MTAPRFSTAARVAAFAIAAWAGAAGAQTTALAPGQVSGAELKTWVEADGLAVGGYNVLNNCQFLGKNGKDDARYLAVVCPGDPMPWTVKGEGRVVGDRWCTKFVYPNGTSSDACEEIFKIGDNRYEFRLDGRVRSRLHRLLP